MAYHSDFWLTAGAVAPVLGLAHVVVLRRYFDLHQAALDAKVKGWRTVVQFLAGFVAILPFVCALLAWIACLSTLLSALHSMAKEQDAAHMQGAINALVVAFSLLGAQLILVPLAQGAVKVAGGKPPKIEM